MTATLRALAARARVFLFFLTPVLLSAPVSAQVNISGTINAYQRVIGIHPNKSRLRVPTSAAFSAGDKVLVIQMKGASVNINTTPTTYGSIAALNEAGRYEYGSVVGVAPDSIFLAGPLCRNYSVPDSVQIVRVPVYPGNVNVVGTLTAQPWPNSLFNGGCGGVIAFEVGGTLTLNAAIDASEAGFRGGSIITGNAFSCGSTVLGTAATTDGRKGEGIAIPPGTPALVNGRGRMATGGGAAGAGNTGGGGGANYGNGGDGGFEYNGANPGCVPNPTTRSYGGEGVGTTTSDRAFFGGGGGGPQIDNFNNPPPGGNGGGIILIKAASINGGGQTIRANGQEVTGLSSDEGGAGGGAGGSIYLQCPAYTGTLTLEAKGGKGSSNNNTQFPGNCHGPGGGGGGGTVWFSTAATPAGVTTNVIGGAAGQVLNPAASCFASNPTHGAQPGATGGVLYNLIDNTAASLALRDTVVCTPTSPVTLSIGSGFTNILWSTGDITPTTTAPGVGSYWVQATTPVGCVVRDTAVVSLDLLTLGNDTTLCPGVSFTIQPRPSGNFVSFQWQNGSPANSFVVTGPGLYWVQVVTVNGCTLRDSIVISYDTIPRLRDTVVCTPNFTATLTYPPGFQNYLWSTGATTNSITVTQGGLYGVIALTQRNCTVGDTASVLVDTMSLGPDTLVCELFTPITLKPRPPSKYSTYLWSNGTTDSTLAVDTTGVYWLTAETVSGCTVRDTIAVEVDLSPVLTILTKDSVLCQGQEVQLSATVAPSGLQYIAWDFGDGTDSVRNDTAVSHGYDIAGSYIVSVSAFYRICPNAVASKVIEVRPFPAINIGPDTSICPGGEPIQLTARLSGAADPLSYPTVWSNGDTARSILARHEGTYFAVATGNGCSASDTVIIAKDCYLDLPNTFTPNGDGTNDYFWPRQLMSQGITSFSMVVYSRWGQKIFETTSLDGRGWDGRYNGEAQPMGVYIYRIEAELKNGVRERYDGNVTLLR